MYKCNFGVIDLPLAKPTSQLPHRLNDAEQAAGRACMSMRQHPAMRIHRKFAADSTVPRGKERTASAWLAQSQLFELYDRNNRTVAQRQYPAAPIPPSRMRFDPTPSLRI
jgi:hypothetical protein